MLSSEMIKKIEDFVYAKPRSIQEIASLINKNWRTADRYIEEIEKNFGTIATRVFREGTRGALKLVYWLSIEKISHSIFQKTLEEQILSARGKDEFSAFDIFQFIEDKNKKTTVENQKEEESTNLDDLKEFLIKVEHQVLIFSGNLSFINLKNKSCDIFKILDGLVKRGIIIKVLCRVDLTGKENIKKLLSLNFKYGKEMVEVKNKDQPLRAIVIDNKMFRIKEIKEPTGKMHELNKKFFIFYTIKDLAWAEWISKIFWKMFSSSIDANKRLVEIEKLKI